MSRQQLQGPDQYMLYKPNGGDALVKSLRTAIYNLPHMEGLFSSRDIHLVDIVWDLKMSWQNDTSRDHAQTCLCASELEVKEGAEVTKSMDVGAAYNGMSIQVNGSQKIFHVAEKTRQNNITIHVPANSTLLFYQKKYCFTEKMFFILDAWGKEWNVGSPGSYKIERKECVVEIWSNEYLTTLEPLNSTTCWVEVNKTNSCDEVDRETKKREDLTDLCRGALSKIGV